MSEGAADVPLLVVRGVVAGYHGIPAVHGIDLVLSERTFLAIVGANGAGKTTTLRAIMGLAEVLEGEIEIGGRSVVGTRTAQRVAAGVALCPEGRMVFPSLTVEENLLTGSVAARSWRTRRESLWRVLESLPALADRRAQRAGTLSGGEQQQLALGRALMSEPSVLLVDEASLGLAPMMVEQVFDLLAGIHRGGTSVIAVEQNIAISGVAEEIAILEHGRLTIREPTSTIGGHLQETALDAYLGGRGEEHDA